MSMGSVEFVAAVVRVMALNRLGQKAQQGNSQKMKQTLRNVRIRH